MNLGRRRFLKPAVFAVAAAWAIGIGLYQFSHDGTSYFYQSKYYVRSATDKTAERSLAKNLCRGEYSKRYDCRSSLLRSNQQQVFGIAVKKLSIVLGPSIVLIVGYRYAVRRRWLDDTPDHVGRSGRPPDPVRAPAHGSAPRRPKTST